MFQREILSRIGSSARALLDEEGSEEPLGSVKSENDRFVQMRDIKRLITGTVDLFGG